MLTKKGIQCKKKPIIPIISKTAYKLLQNVHVKLKLLNCFETNYKFEKDVQKEEIVYDMNVKFKNERMLVLATDDMIKTIKEIKRLGLE